MVTLNEARWRRYQIRHDTEYCYAYAVNSARHRAHLVPSDHADQHVAGYSIDINQPLSESREGRDFFGNAYRDFSINMPHRLLDVRVSMIVDVRAPRWPASETPWAGESLARRVFEPGDQAANDFALMCAPFLTDSPMIPTLSAVGAWARDRISDDARPLHDQLLKITRAIHEEFIFDPEATAVGTPLREVFSNRRGVCQDFAQIMISGLRCLGIPARYVSGYILTHPPPGKPRLVGADATHAWVEAWCPDHGWLGLDPTNGKAVSDEFVILARGRDYADVIPLRGVVIGGGEHTLDVSVTMLPEEEVEASGQGNAKLRQTVNPAGNDVTSDHGGHTTRGTGKNQVAGRQGEEVR